MQTIVSNGTLMGYRDTCICGEDKGICHLHVLVSYIKSLGKL